MSNYIDLEPQVSDYYGTSPGHERRAGICDALRYLDSHPEHVPGRTPKPRVTVSEVTDVAGTAQASLVIRCIEHMDLATVIPDPESANAEHDRDWWVENANVNDAEDCEACEGDLCPVHYGISMGINLMAKKIAALGDDPELFSLIPDPVKAPGGDDERLGINCSADRLSMVACAGRDWRSCELLGNRGGKAMSEIYDRTCTANKRLSEAHRNTTKEEA